jgi:hypothetical protein
MKAKVRCQVFGRAVMCAAIPLFTRRHDEHNGSVGHCRFRLRGILGVIHAKTPKETKSLKPNFNDEILSIVDRRAEGAPRTCRTRRMFREQNPFVPFGVFA